MNALRGEDLRRCWIANADRLARLGHFAKYSPKQHAEVLRKGFLGAWAPDQAIKIARKEVGCEVYFKFQTAGTARSPRVLFWSCHPPKFKRK